MTKIIMDQYYDIIGDTHGCHDTLVSLLETLGYKQGQYGFEHPSRKAIFVGDFIDRGPRQLEVIDTVRAMVDTGHAYAVMGNHEFNAIAYVTTDHTYGGYLRAHSERNARTHRAFLDAMADHPERYDEVINWFKTLPLWLDLDGVRVIHACWDQSGIDRISKAYNPNGQLTEDLIENGNDPKKWEFHVLDNLLKGKTVKLQDDNAFTDPNGIKRTNMRIRWWDTQATTHKAAFIGPKKDIEHIDDSPIDPSEFIPYPSDAAPLFIGHYWMQGKPKPLAHNIACVDYSIAKRHGKLCAYRWDGEAQIDPDKFIEVPRLEA
ncbi:hypothetical protein EOL70_12515 [Leucothrix sargassi]|nr:hypothetical protein EOL70_12515 [Leucothrix sargassi]